MPHDQSNACNWSAYVATLVRNHQEVHPSDVDDLVHDVLFRYIRCNGIDSNGAPIEATKGFLRGITQNRLREYNREHKELSVDIREYDFSSATAGSLSEMERHVRTLLRVLPSKLRTICWLLYFTKNAGDAMTHKAVAMQLGISTKTVSRAVERIEELFRKVCENSGIDFDSTDKDHEDA